jgi:hypothetical protein
MYWRDINFENMANCANLLMFCVCNFILLYYVFVVLLFEPKRFHFWYCEDLKPKLDLIKPRKLNVM